MSLALMGLEYANMNILNILFQRPLDTKIKHFSNCYFIDQTVRLLFFFTFLLLNNFISFLMFFFVVVVVCGSAL